MDGVFVLEKHRQGHHAKLHTITNKKNFSVKEVSGL